MANIKIEQYQVGPISTNCYFAINDDTKEMLVIDPGAEGDRLIQLIEQKKLNPVAVLLTHGHFDHATAANKVAGHFGIKIYAHEAEKETLENPAINLCGMVGEKGLVFHADVFVNDNEELDLAGFHIKVLFTPGHTPGGVCYYFAEEKALFSGDSLFCESIGRTDFPKGSSSSLVRSVREKVLTLPDNVNVYPGHNDLTTIEHEKMYNPYF